MPGLFFYDEIEGKEYNRRKTDGKVLLDVKPEKQRAFFDKLSSGYFGQFLDLVPKSKACEPHTTWATALLVKNRLSSPSSNCTTVIQSALTRHPDYHGTKLEHLAAFEMSGMQNPNGDWPSHHISGMLHFISLIEPL
jgi:hypothetical protein